MVTPHFELFKGTHLPPLHQFQMGPKTRISQVCLSAARPVTGASSLRLASPPAHLGEALTHPAPLPHPSSSAISNLPWPLQPGYNVGSVPVNYTCVCPVASAELCGPLGQGWRPGSPTNWGLPQGLSNQLGPCGRPERSSASHQTLRHTWGSCTLPGLKVPDLRDQHPPHNSHPFKGPLEAPPSMPSGPISATAPRSSLRPRHSHGELHPASGLCSGFPGPCEPSPPERLSLFAVSAGASGPVKSALPLYGSHWQPPPHRRLWNKGSQIWSVSFSNTKANKSRKPTQTS